MIDPLGHRADAATHVVPSTGLGSTPARVNPLPSVRLDELSIVLAAAPQLSPAQSKQIVALLRATLESFAAPVRDGPAGGSLGALQAAVVALGHLQEDLAARLTRHQDQTRTVAPILHALMLSANGDEPAPTAPRAVPSFMRSTAPVPTSVTALAQSLAEAVARLEETLSAGVLMPAVPADPPDAFRWLLDTALPLTTGPARPVPAHGDAVRLTSLAHALLDALQDPEDAAPLQGDLWVALDRYPRVMPVLTPILRELGLAAGNAQLAPGNAQLGPGSVSAEVFATAIARVQILAVIVLAEAEGVAPPVPYRQLLAACEAAGMPPFNVPVDSADNIETYRWLLIAAQLYNSRVTPRPPLQRCNRCGRILRRSRTGTLTCPQCS